MAATDNDNKQTNRFTVWIQHNITAASTLLHFWFISGRNGTGSFTKLSIQSFKYPIVRFQIAGRCVQLFLLPMAICTFPAIAICWPNGTRGTLTNWCRTIGAQCQQQWLISSGARVFSYVASRRIFPTTQTRIVADWIFRFFSGYFSERIKWMLERDFWLVHSMQNLKISIWIYVGTWAPSAMSLDDWTIWCFIFLFFLFVPCSWFAVMRKTCFVWPFRSLPGACPMAKRMQIHRLIISGEQSSSISCDVNWTMDGRSDVWWRARAMQTINFSTDFCLVFSFDQHNTIEVALPWRKLHSIVVWRFYIASHNCNNVFNMHTAAPQSQQANAW